MTDPNTIKRAAQLITELRAEIDKELRAELVTPMMAEITQLQGEITKLWAEIELLREDRTMLQAMLSDGENLRALLKEFPQGIRVHRADQESDHDDRD